MTLLNSSAGGVIGADGADVDSLSQVIADAFHELAPSRWLIPDPAARWAIFPGYFRLYVEHALSSGIVHTTSDRTAVALWLPVGADGLSEPADYGERLAAATSPWTDRFRAFDRVLERHHPTGLVHHHLAILAVRPDRQGQGIGSALLRSHHAALEHETGTAAYLEASDLRTRRLYLAHGYRDHGPPIILAGGPLMYPMWREALIGTERSGTQQTLGHEPSSPEGQQC